MEREIVRGLLEQLGQPDREAPDLGITAAISRWPAWIDPAAFGHYLGRRVDPALPLAEAIGELAIGDLYLACACALGIPAAHAALDQSYAGNLRAALSTLDSRSDFIAEVLQLLREKILVARDGEPKIASYSGHGPLGAWLRVAAMRTALSLRRQRQPELAIDDELDAVLDLAPNAEIRVIARELGSDLRETLRAAVAAQPARIRAIMRMYYADNRGVEDIGRVYNVHASSISRWLAKARTEILSHTRAALLAKSHTEASLDSLLGHVASLEISFDSLLRTSA
ncbi:MAG TPA: hypothetical protein VGC41_07005 [Kofleriaceae bacterium]